MIKTSSETKQKVSSLTEQSIRMNKLLVEKYTSFKDPTLGINESISCFEPIAAGRNCEVKNLDPMLVSMVARQMENFVKYTRQTLSETDRGDMPQWVKTGLALISATYAKNILDDVVSVQSLSNRTGRVHFLDIQFETQKGSISVGRRVFDALQGFYGRDDGSSYWVTDERLGAAGAANYIVAVGYTPVIPNTFTIGDGTQLVRDDGNGNLIGDIAGGVNTINYLTGAINVTFAALTTAAVVANYNYNIEAALALPEVGIVLRSEEVQALPRALAARWSVQSVMDFINDYGINAEPTILDAAGRIIQMETLKHVFNSLRNAAGGGALVWDNAAPAGVPYVFHIKTFSFTLTRLQALIWERTQTIMPNKLIISPDIWYIIEAQDGFVGESAVANDGVAGPRKVGRLTKHGIDVYVDPTYPNFSGVLSYKGPEFVSTSCIVGMYIPLYKAPIHQVAFRKDTALLSEYCIFVPSPLTIGTIGIINV